MHVDVAHAGAEAVALLLVIFAEHIEAVAVFLHAAFRLVERGLALLVLGDGLVRLLVELALDFGEILDLPLNLVALLLLLLRLLLVALLLVLEGGGERCKRSCGNGNCYSQSCKFCVLELQWTFLPSLGHPPL